MSTHTDGARSPSVGSGDGPGDTSRNGAPDGPGGTPGTTPDGGPDDAGADDAGSDPHAGRPPPRQGGRRAAGDAPGDAADGGLDWVQEEIRRRVADRGEGASGRHSRAATTSDGDGKGATPAPRPRSAGAPDAADGAASAPEGPYRMPGPAAAPDAATTRAADPDPTPTPPKQWPPADGAAGLPRRVPGMGWTLDRRTLFGELGTPGGTAGGAPGTGVEHEPDLETRIVPALWSAAPTTRSDPPTTDPDARPDTAAGAELPGGGLGGRYHDELDDDLDDDEYDDEDDEDDDEDDEDELSGLATGETEVIWRAPGLDEPPPDDPGAPAPAPYTGPRPRRFAAAPTDPGSIRVPAAEPEPEAEQRSECPALDDPPKGRRRRVVLSERRNVAHSVRAVVDVQDPGPVGTMFRSRLVSTQLNAALRVGGVALLGLALLPALFGAFPLLGVISLFGVPLPWLLLGIGVYPFLLMLGWWYVRSTERIEQDFVQEVQDR